jgi:hypothetical protein
MFQILTGINAILLYAPVLFGSLGFGANASLYLYVIIGAVLAASTVASIATVDRWGRRALLLSSGIQMMVCQVKKDEKGRVFLEHFCSLCGFQACGIQMMVCQGKKMTLNPKPSGWSWGPLGWTVTRDIFPLETRSIG